ncbi:hypothetical protein SBADM41S_04533 [Streptomyces badius]
MAGRFVVLFTDDLSRVLGSVSTGDVQNLTVSALLMRLMGSSGAASGQVEQLLAAAKELGSRICRCPRWPVRRRLPRCRYGGRVEA